MKRKNYLKYKKENYCIDCDERIGLYAERCSKCNGLFQRKQYFCVDCGKEVNTEQIKRCWQCYLEFNKGKNHHNFIDGRSNKRYYCIDCKTEISRKTGIYGQGRCRTCKLRAINILTKPNKPEKLLNKLLQRLLPKEYKINIKGNIMILGRKVPDFVNINGQKKIIEMYGDYWHSDKFIKKHGCYENTEKGRIKYFKKLGWETLIIWEHELKDLDKVKNRILEFNCVKI